VQAPRALISMLDLLFCAPGPLHGRRKYRQLRVLVQSCKRQGWNARRCPITLKRARGPHIARSLCRSALPRRYPSAVFLVLPRRASSIRRRMASLVLALRRCLWLVVTVAQTVAISGRYISAAGTTVRHTNHHRPRPTPREMPILRPRHL